MNEMEEMDEKAVVRIDSDGAVMKCAKGAGEGCGYKAGAKVCGKCGAMAVQAKKAMEMMEEEEDMDEEMPRRKRRSTPSSMESEEEWTDEDPAARSEKKRKKPMSDDYMMEDEDMDDEEKMEEDASGRIKRKGGGMDGYDGMGDEMPKPKKAKRGVAMGDPKEMDEYDEEDPSAEEMDESDEAPDESNAEMGETPVEAMTMADRKRRMAARKRRMSSMNVKSADWDDDAYLCGFESKMMPGSAQPCAACPGGCAPESDLPTLIEVQGLAEEMLGGKVLDSGYADVNDLFIVDVQRKDGRVAEAVFDGTTAECLGWSLLDDTLMGTKSLNVTNKVVSIEDAISVATKTLPGEVVGVDADVFEGYDVYAVEINGVDGKSYDGFVSLSGELLGFDEYSMDEAVEIDAETAEYALKAMYSEEERMRMAERDMALPDGSFPIKNVEDLKNAIQAFGRAKDKPAARMHIMRRAEALDAMDMIPEEWSEEVAEGKSAQDGDEFLATLMEFELLTAEEDLD